MEIKEVIEEIKLPAGAEYFPARRGRRIGQHQRRRIGHGRYDQAGGGGIGIDLAIVHHVGEAVFAAPIGEWHVGHGLVGVLRERAVGGLCQDAQRERVTFDITVVRHQRQRDAAVFGKRGKVVARHRRIVHRRDREADPRLRFRLAVAHREGKALGAVVVGGRAVGVAAVGVLLQAAVLRRARCGGERVAIDIGGAGEEVERQAAVFEQAGDDGADQRCIVYRRKGQHHFSLSGIQLAVIHHVGKAVGAVPVGRRGVAEAAVGVERERAMRRAADEAGRECGGIDVRRRGQQVAGNDLILRAAERLVAQGGGVVDGVDDEVEARGGGGDAVGDAELDEVGAVPVGRGGVGPGAVGVLGEAAMRRQGRDRRGKGVLIDVAGTGQQVERGVAVFVQRHRALGHDRRIVCRGDGECYRGKVGINAAIRELVGEVVGA